jgi:cytoskeletal protein CcmA (bactofilin family)
MLFRRQSDPATTVTTPAATAATTAPAARPVSQPGNVRSAPLTATPTAPIAQAQQRRVIATPAGSFSMPSNSAPSRDGNRKLQVGRDITLNGEIGACDHLVIEGTVQATIKQLQQFDILDHGRFSGSVTSDNADINGTFDGEITVTGRLWLRANATVKGTIYYGSLQVEKGACLHGTVAMIENKTPSTQPTFPQNDAPPVANDSYDDAPLTV